MRQRRRRIHIFLVLLILTQICEGMVDSYVRTGVTQSQMDPIHPTIGRDPPRVNAVSAMCSSDGITASLSFDRPFSGKIYSRDYSLAPECIYYNGAGQHTVLFSIPAHRCGTKLTRTTRNVIDQMENRVYVQMDKDTQTSLDKQFAFVCQLAAGQAEIAANGTHDEYKLPPTPISPLQLSTYIDNRLSTDSPIGTTPLAAKSIDAYANLMKDPIVPINSDSIRRVSVISRDNHFGNWPIPGARPFNTQMKPIASWPHLPPSPTAVTPPSRDEYVRPGGITPWYSRSQPQFAHSIEPIVSSFPSLQRITPPLGPPLTPSTPSPRAPPMPRPFNDQRDPSIHRPSMPIQNSHPFVFSPLVGVRTESISMGKDSSAEAHPWNDGRVLSSSDQYAVGPTQNGGGTTFVPATRTTVRPGLSPVAAHESDEMSVQAGYSIPPVDSPRELPQKTTTIPVPERVDDITDETVNKDFTTPPVSHNVDLDEDNRIDNDKTMDRMVASQDASAVNTAVFLEIQQGLGPHESTITRPVKIGDNITLVVRSKSALRGEKEFDMFVHSCFATDGPGNTRIELIDKNGCVARPTVVGPMSRERSPDGQQLYFFRISAFKFPGPDDVYFSCSVDMTPGHIVPEICRPSTSRKRRELLNRAWIEGSANSVRLFDNVKVKVADEENQRFQREALSSSESEVPSTFCLDPSMILISLVILSVLITSLIISTIISIRLSIKLHNLQMSKIY
ncbi:cutl-24 [Pristionchus pacificus]|nr:cutl-24 [Pristionchus pacificus]